MGVMGDRGLFVVSVTRTDDSHDLMLVTDSKGRVTHATQALAARLGTTVSRLHSGGMQNALDQLMPPQFMKMHHLWQVPTAPLTYLLRLLQPLCVDWLTPLSQVS